MNFVPARFGAVRGHIRIHAEGIVSISFNAKLGQLFPDAEAASSWLFALAVIHDDLSYEIQHIGNTKNQWEMSYFFRRMTIGLSEAIDLLERHLTNAEFERITGSAAASSQNLAQLRKATKATKTELREVRHRVGGHFSPSNQVSGRPAPPTDATAGHLRAHAQWDATISLGRESHETSYQQVTVLSLLFAWPDVVGRSVADGSHRHRRCEPRGAGGAADAQYRRLDRHVLAAARRSSTTPFDLALAPASRSIVVSVKRRALVP